MASEPSAKRSRTGKGPATPPKGVLPGLKQVIPLPGAKTATTIANQTGITLVDVPEKEATKFRYGGAPAPPAPGDPTSGGFQYDKDHPAPKPEPPGPRKFAYNGPGPDPTPDAGAKGKPSEKAANKKRAACGFNYTKKPDPATKTPADYVVDAYTSAADAVVCSADAAIKTATPKKKEDRK